VWRTVTAAVAANDRDAMAATYHPDAVLVSTTGTTAVQQQLVAWGAGMEKIRRENRRASVAFRFATRQDGETTAFETGMFRYAETDASGVEHPSFVPMEALLVQKVRAHAYCARFARLLAIARAGCRKGGG
jgi:ketosteroid isomerase-like protein